MEMLRTMAAAGFDINAEDELNRSLLRIAVKDKHEKALKTLIKLGVDVEVPSIGNDALDLALVDIIKGHSDFYFVQQLLRAGKRIEDSHRQLLADILLMYPEATQKVIDKYGIVL
jgi:arabinogalactan endo-1,4-beta-galactosidase